MNKNIAFSVVRYGNVAGSRGSVFPEFEKQRINRKFLITDKKMTRFNISLDGLQLLIWFLWSLKNTFGGEIIVPKLPSYKILDLANAI